MHIPKKCESWTYTRHTGPWATLDKNQATPRNPQPCTAVGIALRTGTDWARSALHSEEVASHGAEMTMAKTMHTCVLTAVEPLLHKELWFKAQKHNQDRAHSIHVALAASSRRHGNAHIHKRPELKKSP